MSHLHISLQATQQINTYYLQNHFYVNYVHEATMSTCLCIILETPKWQQNRY